MSDEIYKQIFNNLNQKETEELLAIWYENDRSVWADSAFDAIEEILIGRLGEIPPKQENIGFDEDKSNFDEYTPEFYSPQKVLNIRRWIKKIAIASVVMNFAGTIFSFPIFLSLFTKFFTQSPVGNTYALMLTIIIVLIITIIGCGIMYFALRALESILSILMEMEFNSRGVK